MKICRTIGFSSFWTLAAIFEFFWVSRRPGRYLKTFVEPVASFSQSISPFRAMATPFVPNITTFTSCLYRIYT